MRAGMELWWMSRGVCDYVRRGCMGSLASLGIGLCTCMRIGNGVGNGWGSSLLLLNNLLAIRSFDSR